MVEASLALIAVMLVWILIRLGEIRDLLKTVASTNEALTEAFAQVGEYTARLNKEYSEEA